MGTDYGRGLTNIDPETGIRYGIIPMNRVLSEALGDFEPESIIACPKCGKEYQEVPEDLICTECEYEAKYEDSFYPDTSDQPSFYKADGYELMLDTSGDIWITKSPYKAMAGFCSPCAPGAVYLTDRADDAYGYALGAEWFEDNEVPYEVENV